MFASKNELSSAKTLLSFIYGPLIGSQTCRAHYEWLNMQWVCKRAHFRVLSLINAMAETLHALGLISSNNSTERHLPALRLSLQTHQKRALVKNYTGRNSAQGPICNSEIFEVCSILCNHIHFYVFYAVSRHLYPKCLMLVLKECISSVHAIPGNRIHDLGVLCTPVLCICALCFSQKICINIIMCVERIHSCTCSDKRAVLMNSSVLCRPTF